MKIINTIILVVTIILLSISIIFIRHNIDNIKSKSKQKLAKILINIFSITYLAILIVYILYRIIKLITKLITFHIDLNFVNYYILWENQLVSKNDLIVSLILVAVSIIATIVTIVIFSNKNKKLGILQFLKEWHDEIDDNPDKFENKTKQMVMYSVSLGLTISICLFTGTTILFEVIDIIRYFL